LNRQSAAPRPRFQFVDKLTVSSRTVCSEAAWPEPESSAYFAPQARFYSLFQMFDLFRCSLSLALTCWVPDQRAASLHLSGMTD